MSVCGFLISIEPFDGAVAVAGYEVIGADGFPPEGGAWKSAHSGGVIDG